ncbi:hypothetical protein GHA01_16480 [Novacetimonas hansenii]|uniref:Uncharacterized protein n=1 Tax=Novacetimonas hansenii TaxID=436 RepID=A0ABQ0SF43_NOVHA|nr:hypothetical protein Gaha_0091_014 [Novacetimonas hansenii JCM 7643]GBQ61112.1 hypothetical protein AA0243_2561 [Novacetimonas hansenii NRIC 0243]GEC63799.1 hypothetical protein GHA01_16480 [Novacetimonas hansenii]
MTFRNPGTANEKALALLSENTLRSDPTFKKYREMESIIPLYEMVASEDYWHPEQGRDVRRGVI